MNITYRKVIYISVIVALVVPLHWLGHPAAHQADERDERRAGGHLAYLRSEYDLSQAELGEIDPASESMKLATLGMRGIAANILWTKAIEYRKTQQWDKLSATLNQITKLQPNFIHVWESQAHNLSYNVSVEFDNYEHRYQWVKRGIYYLIDGIQYNRRAPRLTHSVGWFVSQKIGRADERVQFRRLFREDRDFHNDLASHINMDGPDVRGADEYPDNWLVGRQWYLAAYDQTEREGVPVQGTSPLLFYSSAPMNRFNFADTITEEGYLDERSAEAWRTGEREWVEYGNREIPTESAPPSRLARIVAGSAIRLPVPFTIGPVLDQAIDELEDNRIPAWQDKDCHWLAGELVLFLSERGEGELAGRRLTYSPTTGLEVHDAR
jgi:hypothetical protein